VITDGEVFGTEIIIRNIKKSKVRVHCLGIGSASQDRFLTLLARETSGKARFITPRERVDLAAIDLFSSINRPVAMNVKCSSIDEADVHIHGSDQTYVFQGVPLELFGDTQGNKDFHLAISWENAGAKNEMNLPVAIDSNDTAETLRLIHGARLITTMELEYVHPMECRNNNEKRQQMRIANELETLSKEYGLASKAMSLVAIVKRSYDETGGVPVTKVIPVGMPDSTGYDSYFNRKLDSDLLDVPCFSRSTRNTLVMSVDKGMHKVNPRRILFNNFFCMQSDDIDFEDIDIKGKGNEHAIDDILIDLASQIESDGGMPGKTQKKRAANTLIAVMLFAAGQNTMNSGIFSIHVGRLLAYLESFNDCSLTSEELKIIKSIVEAFRKEHELNQETLLQISNNYSKLRLVKAADLWFYFPGKRLFSSLLNTAIALCDADD
jgi:hypothetical protein